MALSERLAILIDINGAAAVGELRKVGDAAEKELGKAEDRSQRMGAKFTQVGIGMMATAATIGVGLYQAGKGAAELEQAVGGTEAVFESSSGVIDTWAKGADQSAGLSEQAARRLTTQIGGALQGLGYAQDEAAEKSIALTQIGADLSATYGGTAKEAVEALGSALRGEFDPMEQFNVFLKQSEIDAKAVEMGLAKNTTEVDKNARAQATLALITEQSGAAQGQFGREADTASGQMAIMEAQTQNAKDALGEGMLPVMSKVSGVLGDAATKFSELDASMGGNLSTVITYGTITLGAVGAVSTLVGWVIKLKSGLVDSVTAMRDSAGSTAQLTRNVAAAAGVVAAAAVGYKLWSDRMAEADDRAAALGTTLDKSIKDTTSWDELNRKIGESTEQTHGLMQASTELLKNPLEWDMAIELAKGAEVTTDAWMELEKLKVMTENYAQENGVSLEVALQEVQAKERATEATEAKAAAEAEATAGMSEAEKAQWKMEEAVAETEKAYSDAAKARDAFWNPGYDLGEAEIAATQAHDDLAASIRENGVTLDLATEAGRNNRTAFMDATQTALDYGESIKKNGGTNLEARDAVLQHVQGLRDQMLQAGFTQSQVDLYIAALKLTPADITTQFNVTGIDYAATRIGDLVRQMQQFEAITAGVGAVNAVGRAFGAGRASGGSVMPNRVHPISERGTEVVETASGAVLVTGNEAASVRPVGNGGGGGQVIELRATFQVDGRTLAESMDRYTMSVQ